MASGTGIGNIFREVGNTVSQLPQARMLDDQVKHDRMDAQAVGRDVQQLIEMTLNDTANHDKLKAAWGDNWQEQLKRKGERLRVRENESSASYLKRAGRIYGQWSQAGLPLDYYVQAGATGAATPEQLTNMQAEIKTQKTGQRLEDITDMYKQGNVEDADNLRAQYGIPETESMRQNKSNYYLGDLYKDLDDDTVGYADLSKKMQTYPPSVREQFEKDPNYKERMTDKKYSQSLALVKKEFIDTGALERIKGAMWDGQLDENGDISGRPNLANARQVYAEERAKLPSDVTTKAETDLIYNDLVKEAMSAGDDYGKSIYRSGSSKAGVKDKVYTTGDFIKDWNDEKGRLQSVIDRNFAIKTNKEASDSDKSDAEEAIKSARANLKWLAANDMNKMKFYKASKGDSLMSLEKVMGGGTLITSLDDAISNNDYDFKKALKSPENASKVWGNAQKSFKGASAWGHFTTPEGENILSIKDSDGNVIGFLGQIGTKKGELDAIGQDDPNFVKWEKARVDAIKTAGRKQAIEQTAEESKQLKTDIAAEYSSPNDVVVFTTDEEFTDKALAPENKGKRIVVVDSEGRLQKEFVYPSEEMLKGAPSNLTSKLYEESKVPAYIRDVFPTKGALGIQDAIEITP
ncbi:MAG: hypothetical protein GY941_22085 [Planctomycetes bacterium]|nr:hypothetical protein [Planctomycetota bacterium]